MIRIDGFGKAGLNTDVEPTLLTPGAWTTLQNIDIESGDIRNAWGESILFISPPIEPKYLYVYRNLLGVWLVISDGTDLYAHTGTQWYDLTPGGVTLGGGEITFSILTGNLIVNSTETQPYYVRDTGGGILPLPGWDPAWRATRIVGYLNFLVALGFDDGTVDGPEYRLAWSDAAAAGEIPQNWDFAGGVSKAGTRQIQDTDGPLTTAVQLRDDLVLYKTDSIYRMYFREDVNVFGIERTISDRGCDAINGVTALGNIHYFADRGDIRMYDGQSTASIANLVVKERLEDTIEIANRDKTYVVGWPEREQIWVGIVPTGQTKIQQVLVYDIVHQAWTSNDQPDVWAMALGEFTLTPALEKNQDAVILTRANEIYRADKSITSFSLANKNCVAERIGFRFANMDGNVTIRRVYPEMEGSATVNFEIGTQWQNGGPITWTAPKAFTIGADRYVKVRKTGMPCGVRITSNTNQSWRLGALSFAVVPARRR